MDINNNSLLFTKIVTQNLLHTVHNSECCKPIVSLGTLTFNKSVFNDLGTYENNCRAFMCCSFCSSIKE